LGLRVAAGRKRLPHALPQSRLFRADFDRIEMPFSLGMGGVDI
jgi:hypothetical protein